MNKKTLLLFGAVALFSLSFVSCSNDDDNSSAIDQTITDVKNYPYSALQPEQQKVKLEQDANSLLTEIDDLKNNECIKVLKAFNNLMEIQDLELDGQTLRSSEDVIYINEFYGKYTWNSATQAWDKTASASQLEMIFPVGSSTANIVVTGVASDNAYINEEETYQLPKEALAKIYLGAKQVGSVFARTDFNADEIPSYAEVTYDLGAYIMETKGTKGNPTEATSVFRKGNKVLFEANTNMSGNLDNLVNDEDPGQMTGKGYVKIMDNLVLITEVDYNKLAQAEQNADDAYYDLPYEQRTEQKEAEFNTAMDKAFNDNSSIYLASRADGSKIARLIKKSKKVTEYWGSYSNTYWEDAYVFEFGDKTTVDAEVYFSSGFNQFITNWENFVKNFE